MAENHCIDCGAPISARHGGGRPKPKRCRSCASTHQAKYPTERNKARMDGWRRQGNWFFQGRWRSKELLGQEAKP